MLGDPVGSKSHDAGDSVIHNLSWYTY
jgi:hypothetical protein